MAGDTTFTFLDATGNTRTARAGSDAGSNLAPSAVLYDVNGNVLIGQKTMAASIPVVLASDQSAVPISSSALATQATLAALLAAIQAGIAVTSVGGNVEITNDAGNAIPIANANLDAALSTLLTLAAFQARINTLGQKTSANSTPVVLPSDQTVPISAASLPLPAGAASNANQATEIARLDTLLTQTDGIEGSLSSLDTKIPASPATTAKQDTGNTSLASLDTKIGEVQASPAANTVLDRLKALLTGIILAAGDNLVGRFKISDGTTVATVRELGANDALNVAITDGSGGQITSFGGGMQYTEGDTDSTITGTALIWEDTSDTLRAVSAAKPLPVKDNGGLPSALGQTTKANSLAVAPASDWTLPKSDFLEVTGSGSAANATPVAATDVGAYRWMSLQIYGTFSATITFEVSNDNSNWYGLSLIRASDTASLPVNTTTVQGVLFEGPIGFRYFRARISSYTSGTVSAIAEFYPFGTSPLNIGGTVALSNNNVIAAGNVASAATDSGNPVKVSGKYNATKPAFTDGQRGDMQIEPNGAQSVADYGFTDATTLVALRTANSFKTATATASGDTAIWTPTSGKKFRVLAYSIEITADAATSGGSDIDIVLRDATTALGMGITVFVPAVAGTAFGNNTSTGWRTIGNGLLSAAANNVLNVNLSAALTSGKVRVNVCGTEE